MENTEGTDSGKNTEPEIRRLKLEKAKSKSAFTKARHRVLALLTDTEIDQAAHKAAWEQVEATHETANDVMTELSVLLVLSDGDDIDRIIIELDRLDVEYSESFSQYQAYRRKLKDAMQGPSTATSSSDGGSAATPLPTGPESDVTTSATPSSGSQTNEGGGMTSEAGEGASNNSQQTSPTQPSGGRVRNQTTSPEGSVSPLRNSESRGANQPTGSEGGVANRTEEQRPSRESPRSPANESPAVGADMWKQLKRVAIPVFSGEVKQYENWKAAFLACIDAAPATPEYKLLQLRQYLSGEALKVIENLGHSAAAYEAARDRLERKYGSKRRQVTLQFEELSDFRTIRHGNAKEVERFADLLDITIINLKDTGLYSELDSKLLYHVLLKKMTEGMVTEYQRWVRQNDKDESIEVLQDWVIEEAEYRTVAHEAIRGLSDLAAGGRSGRGVEVPVGPL